MSRKFTYFQPHTFEMGSGPTLFATDQVPSICTNQASIIVFIGGAITGNNLIKGAPLDLYIALPNFKLTLQEGAVASSNMDMFIWPL
jgi:hypothetical protein